MRSAPFILAALLLLTSSAQGAGLEEARAASARGSFTEAAELYARVLEENPGDVTARKELAQVLSWDGQYAAAVEAYDEALARTPDDAQLLLGKARTLSWAQHYDESLAIYGDYLVNDPTNRAVALEAVRVRSWSGDYDGAVAAYDADLDLHPDDLEVRRERAKVLSWAGRYKAAAAGFRDVLGAAPEDREALLGLARVLSWDKRYDDSIVAYREMLAVHPDDPEAQVGLARTMAWSGDLAGAESGYDAVLTGRPENAEALLGKAQLAFWRGESRESERLPAQAEAASPGNPDIEGLRKAIRRSRQPRVDAAYDRVTDTDGNDHEIYRVSATVGLTATMSLTGLYRHTDAFNERPFNVCIPGFGSGKAEVDFLAARLGWVLPGGIGLLLTAGVDRVESSVGDRTTRAVGSAVAFGPIRGNWRWRAALERRTFDATRDIVDCNIFFTALNGGVSGTWHKWKFAAGAGFTDFSDGNDRIHTDLSAIYPFAFWGQTLDAGYRFRYMSYSQDLAKGYFDPQLFTSHLATGALRGKFFHPRLDYTLRIDVGIQSFDWDANTTDTEPGVTSGTDTIFGYEIRLGWNITERARLEAYFGENDYAAQSATGFESQHSGLLFRYRF